LRKGRKEGGKKTRKQRKRGKEEVNKENEKEVRGVYEWCEKNLLVTPFMTHLTFFYPNSLCSPPLSSFPHLPKGPSQGR